MVFRKGAGLALNLFRYFTSHPARTRASLSQLVAGTPGLGPSILVDNATRVPIFSSAEPLCNSTPKLESVSGISWLRSPIFADNTAKIPIFSTLIHRRLGVYHRNRFFGCGAKRLDHVELPRGPNRWFQNERIVVLVSFGVVISVVFGNWETVPYTKRKHFVLLSRAMERKLGETLFKRKKSSLKGKILPPVHPDSVRVRLISQEIIQALQRGLSHEQL